MEDAVARTLSQRRRRRLGRLRPAGVVSALIAHLALVALAVVVPILDAEETEALEIVNVRIVPSRALGTPEPPSPEVTPTPPQPEPEPEEEAPPEPEPEPEPEEEPPPRRPEPDRMVLPSETAEPEATPEPQPRRDPPLAAEPTPPSERRGAPTGSPMGSSATGSDIAAIGDPDFTYGYYLDRVLALIEANWRRPPTDGVALQVVVNFRIRRDGQVFELDVAEPSGHPGFDLAGLRAVQAASPLPPLPAGFRKDSLAIRLVIR